MVSWYIKLNMKFGIFGIARVPTDAESTLDVKSTTNIIYFAKQQLARYSLDLLQCNNTLKKELFELSS